MLISDLSISNTLRKSSTVVLAFTILLLSAGISNSQTNKTDSRGRRWMHLVEPPPPAPDWNSERAQQLSLAQIIKEFGIWVEYKITGRPDALGLPGLLPENMQLSIIRLDGDRIKLEMGAFLPKVPGAVHSALGKLSFEFSANAPTISEAAIEAPISPSTKITSSIKYDQINDPNWTLGVELQKLFLKFKGELASGGGGVTKTVEISLDHLFRSARGLKIDDNVPRDRIIKVDPQLFYNGFVKYAPRIAKTSEDPAKKALNGVMIQFNPALQIAAIQNNSSFVRLQKAAAEVQRSLANELPKGVKIEYDEALLERLIYEGNASENEAELARLGRELEVAKNQTDRDNLLSQFVRKLKREQLSRRGERMTGDLVAISLRNLVTSAEPYRDRWSELPDHIKNPGGISRLIGFRQDPAHDDIWLIGEKLPNSTPLSIDDLIVGLRSVWKNNLTPFCSLDPDPANFTGPQFARIAGVPIDSGFALGMLEADYLAKKMLAGLARPESPGYKSMADIARRNPEKWEKSGSRFWFYPVPLETGDIQISPDGGTVVFNSEMQLLSEHMVLSNDGLLSTGTTDPLADEWATAFSAALPDLEMRNSEYRRLHGLFDVVLLSRIWQKINLSPKWVDRLTSLPYAPVKVPATYEGITAVIIDDKITGIQLSIQGGVRLRTIAGPRAWLVTDQQPGFESISETTINASTDVARSVAGSKVFLPKTSNRSLRTLDRAAVFTLLAKGQSDAAGEEIRKLILVDPYDPEPWSLRAILNLTSARYNDAIDDADHASAVAPGDVRTFLLTSFVKYQAYVLTARFDEALSSLDQVLASYPDSANSHILKADLLAVQGSNDEAQASYRNALQIDPDSVRANVSFGIFRITQGFVVSGKKLIDKARLLDIDGRERFMIKSADALAEIGIAILENPESHLANAHRLASEVLADPSADIASRFRALHVLTMLAFINNDVSTAEKYILQAVKIAPRNPVPYLVIVDWAISTKRFDLARAYLERAERISPDFPAVKKLRTQLGSLK